MQRNPEICRLTAPRGCRAVVASTLLGSSADARACIRRAWHVRCKDPLSGVRPCPQKAHTTRVCFQSAQYRRGPPPPSQQLWHSPRPACGRGRRPCRYRDVESLGSSWCDVVCSAMRVPEPRCSAPVSEAVNRGLTCRVPARLGSGGSRRFDISTSQYFGRNRGHRVPFLSIHTLSECGRAAADVMRPLIRPRVD